MIQNVHQLKFGFKKVTAMSFIIVGLHPSYTQPSVIDRVFLEVNR